MLWLFLQFKFIIYNFHDVRDTVRLNDRYSFALVAFACTQLANGRIRLHINLMEKQIVLRWCRIKYENVFLSAPAAAFEFYVWNEAVHNVRMIYDVQILMVFWRIGMQLRNSFWIFCFSGFSRSFVYLNCAERLDQSCIMNKASEDLRFEFLHFSHEFKRRRRRLGNLKTTNLSINRWFIISSLPVFFLVGGKFCGKIEMRAHGHDISHYKHHIMYFILISLKRNHQRMKFTISFQARDYADNAKWSFSYNVRGWCWAQLWSERML